MQQNINLKEFERKAYGSYHRDGLLDILLGSFVSLFAVAPLLSSRLGDFWSSVIFLPIWSLIFLIVRFVRRHVTIPRLGIVKYGRARKRKLKIFTIAMLIMNGLALLLGVVVSYHGDTQGSLPAVWFGIITLAGFSVAAHFLDFPRLYLYGIMVALSSLVGEWLYRTHGVPHHGFPLTFGVTSGIIVFFGLFLFVRFMRNSPLPEHSESEVVQ